MRRGNLDRKVQFQRYVSVNGPFGSTQEWATHGDEQWASKSDVSDAERWRAGEVSASITTRFMVRWSDFTRDLTPKDRLTCDGVLYEISGIKEGEGRRRWLEITASARSDQ